MWVWEKTDVNRLIPTKIEIHVSILHIRLFTKGLFDWCVTSFMDESAPHVQQRVGDLKKKKKV